MLDHRLHTCFSLFDLPNSQRHFTSILASLPFNIEQQKGLTIRTSSRTSFGTLVGLTSSLTLPSSASAIAHLVVHSIPCTRFLRRLSCCSCRLRWRWRLWWDGNQLLRIYKPGMEGG